MKVGRSKRRKSSFVIGIATIFSCNALANSNTIDCKYVESYSAAYNGKKWEVEQSDNDKNLVTFTELNSDSPKLVGNAGVADLKKLDAGTHIYLLEPTPSGNLNVWTYFPKEGVMVGSKQYHIAGPLAYTWYFKCKGRSQLK